MAKAATIPGFVSGFRLFLGESLQTLADCLSGAQAVPSGFQAQAGSSTASFGDTGNISVQPDAVGSGVGNAAATTNTVLMTYALPANALDKAGRQLTITAAGSFASNADNKTVQIYVGTDVQTVGSAIVTTATTSIASSGVVVTSGGGWIASALVTALSATSQLAVNMGIQAGATHLGTTAPQNLSLAGSSVIYISVTGASPTTGAANDVVCDLMDVAYNN